jgi:hypothetical protein
MKHLHKIVLTAVALASLSLATPAQAHWYFPFLHSRVVVASPAYWYGPGYYGYNAPPYYGYYGPYYGGYYGSAYYGGGAGFALGEHGYSHGGYYRGGYSHGGGGYGGRYSSAHGGHR